MCVAETPKAVVATRYVANLAALEQSESQGLLED